LAQDFAPTEPRNRIGDSRIVVHRDGWMHVLALTNSYSPTLLYLDPEISTVAVPREERLYEGYEHGNALFDDGANGVWIATGDAAFQHYDETHWPLYRQWVYGDGCGDRGYRPGIVTRTGPDAEPMTYFYDNGWPPRPRL
jgi:hypothetical protein